MISMSGSFDTISQTL